MHKPSIYQLYIGQNAINIINETKTKRNKIINIKQYKSVFCNFNKIIFF